MFDQHVAAVEAVSAASPADPGAWWFGLGRGCRSAWQDMTSALAVDLPLASLLLVYALLWVPLLGRVTDNPRHLAAFINDEPMITQQLVGMTLWPYGHPGNLMQHPERRPAEWETISYPNGLYYGGTYLNAAFLVYAPLKWLGLPDFPMAPVILRSLSVLFGLLALVILYNLGKEIGGRATGFGATLLLLLDPYFNHYSGKIHPDTAMTALTLLALWVASRHVRRGDGASLVTLGLLVGLVHGSKMGGPWLFPVALLAVLWGGCSAGAGAGTTGWRRCWWLVSRRGTLLALLSLTGFALSTPYAFLNRHYFAALKVSWNLFTRSPLSPVTYAGWFRAIWEYEGPVFLGLVGLGLVLAGVRCWKAPQELPPALVLTIALALSVVAFYTTMVRVWIAVFYLVPVLGLLALLATCAVVGPLQRLAAKGAWGQRSAATLYCCGVLAILYFRSANPLSQVLLCHCQSHATVEAVGRWARDHLPPGSTILLDDLAYFDPKVFPEAAFHGGLLTYADLERLQPDYFLLSGSIYQAAHYVELRKTQHYTRARQGPFSVLLYQDALDHGGLPEAELLATFRDETPPASQCPGPGFYSWTGRSTPGDRTLPEGGRFCQVLTLARLALGLEEFTIGSEIRFYRYRPAIDRNPVLHVSEDRGTLRQR